jgi:magnesium-transporting ATPase (P-type)
LNQGIDILGRTGEHWFHSTVAFTVIIHIIIYKLFLETVFWNTVSIVTCLLCAFLYYGVVLMGNTNIISNVFQPQLNGQFFLLLANPRVWLLLIGLPGVALLPDIIFIIYSKVLTPTPTDIIMQEQKEFPNYKYPGFKDYDAVEGDLTMQNLVELDNRSPVRPRNNQVS